MLHRIIKISSFICLTLILAVSGVLGWHFISAQAVTPAYELGGWFWTANYGWISLNSGNAELKEYHGQSYQDYKVVSAGGDIAKLSGWGWSSHVGWVCFGETCDQSKICALADASCHGETFGSPPDDPDGWHAEINSTSHQFTGWAKVVSLGDYGLIKLGMGDTVSPPLQPDYKSEYCYDCTDSCVEWNYESNGATPPVQVQTTCKTYTKNCNTCFTQTYFDGQNIPTGATETVAGGNGNTCFGCSACNVVSSTDLLSSRVTCNSCNNCSKYGGAYDSSNGALLGWGWNGNVEQASTTGAGWVHFNPVGGDSGVIYPWLQTEYGAVYGSRYFRQRTAVVSGINATYCIFADLVFNFRSQKCGPNIPSIDLSFPVKQNLDSSESYKNALGQLDIKGLSTVVKTSGSQKYNKYGNIIEVDYPLGSSIDLNNRVYVYSNDLVIGSDLIINNGSDTTQGNGLVIVNGDLLIKNNITYSPGNPANLKRLASIGWIVKGDISIQPDVTQVVGAFIALGNDPSPGCMYENDTPCINDTTIDYPKFKSNGYGVFSSGSSDKSLVISGLLLARAFNFQRTYSNILQGSEKIIYDGRLIANPPPGLRSLVEMLPVIRDF
ncbi:MAG: hypothetical protein WCT26_01235 [Candidatus Buchananbacteria bacterium]|jgi:hypothetical protein